MAHKIDAGKCVACGCCKDACPAEAIAEGSPYTIDPISASIAVRALRSARAKLSRLANRPRIGACPFLSRISNAALEKGVMRRNLSI